MPGDEEAQIRIYTKGLVEWASDTIDLEHRIRNGQNDCPEIQDIHRLMKQGKCPDFQENEQGATCYKNIICVPSDKTLC